jgi:CRISPR-associated protein Csm5
LEKVFRKVRYKTLSPLHIGDGSTSSSLEYFPYGGKIHLYSSEDLKSFLTGEQFEDFIKYAINNESPSLLGFFRTYSNTEQILKVASGKASHSFRFWGSEIPSRIWMFTKSRNQPYIPGTEIKGALRTAVLRKLIFDGSSRSLISNGIKDIKNRFSSGNIDRKGVRKELEKLEERISARVFRLTHRNDAKFDFMKFILISDAYSKDVERLVANIQTKNTSRPIGDFHEIVPNNVEFQGGIGIVKGKQFEEFVNRFQADSQRRSFFSNIEHIFTACYEMSKEVIEEEMKFYRRLKVNSAINQLEEIKKSNSKSSPVIRIGKHQGFMSITLAELVKKLGEETYKDYVELLKSTGRRIYTNDFPKTRKVLVNTATKEELTLGWIKIEVE